MPVVSSILPLSHRKGDQESMMADLHRGAVEQRWNEHL